MINGFVVTDEMIKAARTAFHDVRLREASSRRAVREWEAEAWRCAIEAAWNRRAPSVTREEIARAIWENEGGVLDEIHVAEIANAILALLRDNP